MKISEKSGIIALLATSLLLAVIFVPSMSANADKTKSEKALDYISQKHGIPKEQLKITNEKEANFPLSNQKIWSVNILDPKGKEFYYVDLDEAGNTADIKAAKALEYAKYREKYGKKEIALHEKLQKMKADDTVEVGIWLSPVVTSPFPEHEISEQEYKEILEAKKKVYAEKEKPVLDILEAKNINIRYASQFAPLIYAEVPVKLMDEVENIPEVDGIYLAREFQPLLNIVNQTVRVQSVWDAGINGSGIKVAVVEEGAINFSIPGRTSNRYLNTGLYNNSSARTSNHATEVAGIIASTHSDYKGISPGVPGLLSANFGTWQNVPDMESRVIRASEWAINNGTNILTNSYGNETGGVLSGIDKYFDHVVWDDRKTVIVAAGNEGQNTGNVQSPGLGYNVVTVGGFEDNNTDAWLDDMIWSGSSYVDPSSQYGDREKPEVVAIATHGSVKITTTKAFEPWIDQTDVAGTSYAAPQVAAEAALLMQANTSLKEKPEVIKAIIMASAVHNIENESRLSDKDGAGGIDISNAYATRTAASNITASSYPQHFNFSVTAGQKIRAVITWNSHPDSNHPPVSDELQSDLNLVVYNPSSSVVGTSDSFDNSYEIVEFTASETGTYNAQIQARTYNGSEKIGFAKAIVALPGWSNRKLKTINGTTAGAQTNYQMKLTVYNTTGTDSPGIVYLGGNAKSDFGDLRFTKSDGVTLLDYWIESYTSGVNATVWVEVDSIPASPGTADIYLYYGNPSATSASSGAATFRHFDDFDSGSNWYLRSGATISGGNLTINVGYKDHSAMAIYQQPLQLPYALMYSAMILGSDPTGDSWRWFDQIGIPSGSSSTPGESWGCGYLKVYNGMVNMVYSDYWAGAYSGGANLTTGVWYTVEQAVTPTFNRITANGVSSTNTENHADNRYVGFGVAYQYSKHGWMAIRNYASPAPAWT